MELPINYEDAHWSIRKQAREQYVKEQNGLCQYCQNNLEGEPHSSVTMYSINKSLFPPSMFNYPVHLHHNRENGMTIGAVHARCNAYLWQYKGE